MKFLKDAWSSLRSSTSSWSYRPNCRHLLQAKLSSPTDPRSYPEPPTTSSLSSSPDDIDLVKSQFHEVLLMLENRDFVLYSQTVGIIHLLR